MASVLSPDAPRPETPAPDAPRAAPPGRTRVFAVPEARWALAALATFLLALPAYLLGAPGWLWGPLFALTYATGGWEPGWEGLRALRERTLDVDLLMVVAALGAAAIGQVLDGALLIVIFATSGALEAIATARTADSVRGLLDLAPATATRLTADGREEVVATGRLAVGDTLLVRPGEHIGADGRVLGGVSEVDQATITGEPLPVTKQTGDEVFAGTLNGAGALRVEVRRDPSDSVLARIVAMVEEASRTKAPTQLFIEKVEQRYSLAMVAATVALFTVPLLWGAALQPTLLRAMTFMIVASPCAVVLATMPPLLSAIANAGRHGVLVKSAVVMERLAQADTIAMDKTGTLTEGTPRVTEVCPLPASVPGSGSGSGYGYGYGEETVLRLAAAAEHPSEHPLARAVVDAARDRGLTLPTAVGFTSSPGTGVTATVEGRTVRVGSPARLTGDGSTSSDGNTPSGGNTPPDGNAAPDRNAAPDGITSPHGSASPYESTSPHGSTSPRENTSPHSALSPARAAAARLEAAGSTAVLVLVDGAPAGILGIADRLRPDAAAAVTSLTALAGRPPVLLTGDNARAADRLAGEVGITDVRAGLLPQDKVAAVGELGRAGGRVLVVGDGVNDAPALAAAHAGVAMGGTGSDLALESADAVVVRDELAAIPRLLRLSRRARRLVVQNLVIAGVFIAGLVVWDLAGTLPLPLGVAGHEGSTVLVGLNGLRLLADRAWNAGAEDG
ncbi:heavy metal translocating P-type ATPase [Streptomyces albus subsp. chlorinus]|uniref:heavy metal translocating P-type ATPase n=1 Tax=Streptomyces albus TaxID=1888 RepID=UPI00156ECC58|nr:heavy metal translocating P-type ATPase [Streptomyces albus]NSC24660.1 heavy metal translocating P-type ATPase [Streptomyces albus subsp. chlorinus]